MKIFMQFSALLAWIIMFIGAATNLAVLTGLGALGIIILLVISLNEVAASTQLDKNKKLMWIIGLLPLNMFIMPAYYLGYRKNINRR